MEDEVKFSKEQVEAIEYVRGLKEHIIYLNQDIHKNNIDIVLNLIKKQNLEIELICDFLSKGNQIAGTKEQIKEFFEKELKVE